MSEAVLVKPKKKGKSKVKQKKILEPISTDENVVINIVQQISDLTTDEAKVEERSEPDSGVSVVEPSESLNILEENHSVLIGSCDDVINHEVSEVPSENCSTIDSEHSVEEIVQSVDPEKTVGSIPSAPDLSISQNFESYWIGQGLQLPVDHDEGLERPSFPLTFEDSVSTFMRQREISLAGLKPFTEAQMKAFSQNHLLESEPVIRQSFLDCQKNLDSHPLFESLNVYLRSCQAAAAASDEIRQLNQEINELSNQLWTQSTQRATGIGECSDNKQVRAQEEYAVAHFNQKACGQLARRLKQRRELHQEQLTLHLYQSTLYKLRVDSLVSAVESNQVHAPLSIVFSFLRRPIRDEQIIHHLRHWLNYLAVELLKEGRQEDFLFLAHHVLRCPAGVSRWARPYLQTPLRNPYSQQENVPHADVAVSLLSLVCQTASQRDEFLKSWLNDEEPVHRWVWLDSDGEDDADESSATTNLVLHLTDNDLLALVNQIPMANVYRHMFAIEERDGQDVLGRSVESREWLPILARSLQLLRILRQGLDTYSGTRYKNFAKKIGQLVLHVVCNLCDFAHHWNLLDGCPGVQEGAAAEHLAMRERLIVEFEHVVIQGLSILIRGRHQRLWHFLSLVPFDRLTPRIKFDFWLQLHGQIDGKVDEGAVQGPAFWTSFVTKLIQLPEPDLFVFLVTLSSLVGPNVSPSDPLLHLVVWELSELALLEEGTRDVCFKTGREVLIDLICKCPSLVTFLIQRIDSWLQRIPNGSAALHFFKEFPLQLWRPSKNDLQILRSWILKPLDSVQHQLAITVLTALNWGLDQWGVRPFLGRWFHRQTAILLIETVKVHGRLGPIMGSGVASLLVPALLQDSLQIVSNLLCSWKVSDLEQWIWRLALKLRLHTLDLYPTHVPWILGPGLSVALAKVPNLGRDADWQMVRDGISAGDALSAYVALSATDAGHVVPEFCSSGIDLLVQLATAQFHRPIIFLLDTIFPLFVHCADVLYAPKMISVLQSVVQADSTYYKLAKNLLVVQFPGQMLQLLASLVENVLANFSRWNLREPWPLLEIWVNLLTRLAKWNADKSVLYLLDVLARIALEHPRGTAVLKAILHQRLLEPNVHRPPKGLASRVGSWVSGSSNPSDVASPADLDATELVALNPAFPYLYWIVLDLELDRQRPFWNVLKNELQPGRHKNSDQAFKATTAAVKTVPLSSLGSLCLFRYAQMAANDLAFQHPLQPLVLQRFFALYFARPELINVESWSVGERLFKANSTTAALWKNLTRRLAEWADRSSQDPILSSFYTAASLWVKDVKLLEPNVYLPTLGDVYSVERLLAVFQDDGLLWMDLYDRNGAVRTQRQQLRQRLWNERNDLLPKLSPINEGRVGAVGLSGSSSLLARLKTYEEPLPLKAEAAVLPPLPRQPGSLLEHPAQFHGLLRPHLNVIQQKADKLNRLMAELTALDCHFVELQSEKHASVPVEKVVAVKCCGSQGGACSGSALVRLSFRQWKVNDHVCRQMDSNRQDCQRICDWLAARSNLEPLCLAALFLEQSAEEICRQSTVRTELLQLGAEFFYQLVILVNEETNSCLPTKQLLATCIELLGQRCISGQVQQSRNLIGLLSTNPNLAGVLAPHFTPLPTQPCPEATEAFLECYQLLTNLSKNEADLIFVLLTKFDIGGWLKSGWSRPADRSRLLQLIAAALEKHGLEPKTSSLAVHEVLRRHWQHVFMDNFPEQFRTGLELVIRSSESQSCSVLLWCDLINTLGQGWLRFRPETKIHEFRHQVLQYTTQQTLLNMEQLTETALLLSQLFSRERQLHGLYGLYPKYRPYIEAIASFLLIIGHSLCFATLQNDTGTRSEVLVGRLWTLIRELYSPWILPYSQQQVTNECATWIQQLSSDRKLLLPWIAADSPLAASVVASLISCVGFLHETIPSQDQSALSHLLAFYLQGFCHAGIKPHIYQVLHEGLDTLPWNTLIPSLSDLEHVVRVTGQYLPEVHSFLVTLVTRWNLADIWTLHPVSNCGRVMTYLLQLYVRLGVEPTARQNAVMKRLLEEACNFPWHHVGAGAYEKVLNWYVSTCDPLFVIQNQVRGTNQVNASYDAIIFRLLQSASGYGVAHAAPGAIASHADGLLKRQIFVKSWIRLMSLTVSRYRSVVDQKPKAVAEAVNGLLQFITAQASGNAGEYGAIFREYLAAACSSTSVGDELQFGLCRWIESSKSSQVIEGILPAVFSPNGQLNRLTRIAESALEHYDGTWSAAIKLAGLPATREMQPVAKDLLTTCARLGCLLTWYCLTKNDNPAPVAASDVPGLLEHLLAVCKLIPLSEPVEPKLVLIYERLLLALDAAAAAVSAAVDENEKEKMVLRLSPVRNELSHLLSLWAEESKGLLSSIGLGKPPSLSSKGRCLARIVRSFLLIQADPAASANPDTLVQSQCDQLEKLGAGRSYADCRPAIESALELFRKRNQGCHPDGVELLRRLVPHLYCRRYLSHLVP